MNDAIIMAGGVILGTVISGGTNYFANRQRLKSEQLREEKQICELRIQKFYSPLLKMLKEGSPPDEYSPPESIYPKVFDFIEKNEMYATRRLLDIFWKIQYNFAINGHSSSDEKYKLFSTVSKEHNKLKEMVGFKEILAKDID